MLSYLSTQLTMIRRCMPQPLRRVSGPVLQCLKDLRIFKYLHRGTRSGRLHQRRICVRVTARNEHLTQRCNMANVNNNKETAFGVNIKNLTTIRPIELSGSVSTCLINCRSVCNKTTEIRDLVTDRRMDLLCLTETWMSGSEKDNPVISALLPDGYDIVNCARDSRGGGVALIHKKEIRVKNIRMGSKASFEAFGCLVGTQTPLRVILVYRPPPSQGNDLFVRQFMI